MGGGLTCYIQGSSPSSPDFESTFPSLSVPGSVRGHLPDFLWAPAHAGLPTWNPSMPALADFSSPADCSPNSLPRWVLPYPPHPQPTLCPEDCLINGRLSCQTGRSTRKQGVFILLIVNPRYLLHVDSSIQQIFIKQQINQALGVK